MSLWNCPGEHEAQEVAQAKNNLRCGQNGRIGQGQFSDASTAPGHFPQGRPGQGSQARRRRASDMSNGYHQTLRIGDYTHMDTGTRFFYCDECGRTIGQMTEWEAKLKPDQAVIRLHRQMDEHAWRRPECQTENPKAKELYLRR